MQRAFLILPLALALYAQNAPPSAKPGSVAGRVIDAQNGDAISAATVRLFPRAGAANRVQPSTTSSLSDGSFRFESVVPGTYTVFVQARGFTSAGAVPEVVAVGEGGTIAGVSLKLNPFGSVSGRVLDNAGRPVEQVEVELFRSYSLRGRMQATRVGDVESKKDGTYLFRRVTPGKYYVSAFAEKSARTYYASTLHLEEATPVDLAPGASSSGADITLQYAPTFKVRGKVENFLPDALEKSTRLLLAPRDLPAFTALSESAIAQADGTFTLAHISNGSYTLWLVGRYGTESNNRRNRRRVLARQDLDVNGSDVNGVSLALMPPVNISGRLVLGGAPANANLGQLRVALQPAVGFGSPANTVLSGDGSFSFADLDPGDYMLRVTNLPAGMYLEQATLNRQDVLATGVDLSQGGGGNLDIVVRNGAGEVDGSIEPDHGEAPLNGVALLVPETPAADGSGVLSGILKPGGVFSIDSVRPGRYFAFAVAEWDSIWQNADFQRAMQREGTSVEVSQNSHIQLQLRMMPREQVESGAERLGLSLQ